MDEIQVTSASSPIVAADRELQAASPSVETMDASPAKTQTIIPKEDLNPEVSAPSAPQTTTSKAGPQVNSGPTKNSPDQGADQGTDQQADQGDQGPTINKALPLLAIGALLFILWRKQKGKK